MDSYRRLIIVGFVVLLAFLTMWLAGSVLLLLFCGVLLAVVLQSLALAIGNPLRLPHGVSFALALMLLLGLFGGVVYFTAPQVANQATELWQTVGTALQRVRETLHNYFPDIELPASRVFSAPWLTAQLFGLTSSAVGLLMTLGIIFFVGVYTAADPSLYIRGFLRLFTPQWRPRIEELLTEMSRALRRWLLGRAIAMSAVGILMVLGLWIGGIRLAFALGLIAGVLTFIPYLGAIASAVPAVLIAGTQGPGYVVYTLAIFSVAHVLEAYVIVPLVQQQVIHLPPALLLAAQALLGAWFGVIGVALAAPLTAMGMVAVQILYLRDILNEEFVKGPPGGAPPS